MSNIKLDKYEIRKQYKSKRRKMTKEERVDKSCAAQDFFIDSEIYKKSKTIMLYLPLDNEVDTDKIVKTAFSDGKNVVVPVTSECNGEIVPFYINEDTEYVYGLFSVLEPKDGEIAGNEEIDVIIVPGVAFSGNGVRLGFGKGCYDRFLSHTSSVKIGLCYGFQVAENLPSEEHDVKMDYLLTEQGIVKCR